MIAIIFKPRLRQNATNCFIVSLAAADLLLGTVVMPFSIIEFWRSSYSTYPTNRNKEMTVFYLWPYGQDWCDAWHAFDVLSCTASILNLCVISVERYIAISDPFNYQSKMTHSRCLCMIAIAWICSAMISFPAIAWWRASTYWTQQFTGGQLSSMNTTVVNLTLEGTCIFPEDQLYLFISSCVSFHLPLLVMIFVYWRIYRTATMVLKSLTCGIKTIPNGNKPGENLVLRVHRGGSNKNGAQYNASISPIEREPSFTQNAFECPGDSRTEIDCGSFMEQVTPENSGVRDQHQQGDSRPPSIRRVHFDSTVHPNNTRGSACCLLYLCSCHECNPWTFCTIRSGQPVDTGNEDRKPRLHIFKKRLNRFLQEKRAAKTLGMIMGVFIFCWLPFFVYNTIKSISPSFIRQHDEILFPLFTWLGYVNSSMNPFIYAYSLRDIRRAFSEILCIHCGKKRGRVTLTHSNFCSRT
ncbi:7 transmembrane receptor [Paragonimus heterotremus]|uniref:7 transmembrane receptor n=1 Tax=Paragonimus heterotremus TaxID=100268 RepID=A0A8J4WL13_9TREM|nr:7 transmembrane receptor [Paragonimus heterotremus]